MFGPPQFLHFSSKLISSLFFSLSSDHTMLIWGGTHPPNNERVEETLREGNVT